MNHSNYLIKIVFTIFCFILIGCQSQPNFETLRSEISDLHQTLINAHWEKNIDFFITDISDDFISVGNGEISQPTRAEIKANFESYLNNTTFSKYQDLREPIIGFSKDGSLAWSIVQVKVAGVRSLDDGTKREMDYTCAWVTLYEREGDKWIRFAESSSFK